MLVLAQNGHANALMFLQLPDADHAKMAPPDELAKFLPAKGHAKVTGCLKNKEGNLKARRNDRMVVVQMELAWACPGLL